MYIVRFIRRDGQPDEEYFYNFKPDAENHLNLFRDDDSELYKRIEVLRADGSLEMVLDAVRF